MAANLNCPICDNSKINKNYDLPDGILYYCPDCKHRFTDPNSIKNQESYNQSYYDDKHRQWFENPDLQLFEYIYREISKHNPNASVLDVGCGNGAFLKFLRSKSSDLKLTGIDFHPNESTDDIEFLTGNFLETEFKESFDVIVNLAVIEHIWDVKKFTNGLYNLCKTNGTVITMTVNDQSIIYQLSRILKPLGIPVLLDRLYEKHHLNHFGVRSLEKLMTSQGGNLRKFHAHTPNNAAIDTPSGSKLVKFFYKLGLAAFLMIETLTKRTILQTIVVQKQ